MVEQITVRISRSVVQERDELLPRTLPQSHDGSVSFAPLLCELVQSRPGSRWIRGGIDPWPQGVDATPPKLGVTHVIPRDRVLQFWELIRTGLTIKDAAAGAGVAHTSGRAWFREAGGVLPPITNKPSSGRYLSVQEREKIFSGVEQGLSMREIAQSVGRAPSTVKRELNRNLRTKYRHRQLHGGIRKASNPAHKGYTPSAAQQNADRNASRPKVALPAGNDRLRDEVQARLRKKNSPEQISGRLRIDFPDNLEMRVSHETIYQSLYVEGRGALKRKLTKCLRTGRALHKPRRKSTERRGRIQGMVNISERPPEVEDRVIPGHWEGDLIVGANSGSAIGTLVERTVGFVMLLHLPDRHGAPDVQEAIIPTPCPPGPATQNIDPGPGEGNVQPCDHREGRRPGYLLL